MARNINQYSFVVDAMLGKIARKLRLFGFDTVYDPNIDDMDILNSLKYYGRIILTNDQALIKRCKKRGINTILLNNKTELENLVTIFRTLDIKYISLQNLFHVCTCCNGIIETIIDKNSIKNQIPDRLLHSRYIFYKCSQCNKIYWIGTHIEHIACLIRDINIKLAAVN
jgi:uncharacterized protein with PIN domain